jgi:hypothetical protein
MAEIGGTCSTHGSYEKYIILIEKPAGKSPLGRPRRRWEDNTKMVRFQVLKAASMKMTVFWDVASCSQVRRLPMFQRRLLPPSSGPSWS